MNRVVPLARAMRPRQWVKNLLVVAAPFAAGALGQAGVLLDVVMAFVAFSLAASGVYLLNDARDVEFDRRHERKRHRPIASGAVPVPLAVVAGIVLIASSLGVAALATPAFMLVLLTYLALNVAYVLWLKHVPVLDIAVVASGFLLRALAGGAATGIPISDWFLLVAGFASLFVVAGKRYSELVTASEAGDDASLTRSTLGEYTAPYLRFVWTVSAAVTVMVYGLWVITVPRESTTATLASVLPFTLALLVYARDVDRGAAGEPEDVVLRDPALLILGVMWAASLAVTLYVQV